MFLIRALLQHPLSTWNVASVTDTVNFSLHVTVVHLNSSRVQGLLSAQLQGLCPSFQTDLPLKPLKQLTLTSQASSHFLASALATAPA